jgi:hypothetical protein
MKGRNLIKVVDGQGGGLPGIRQMIPRDALERFVPQALDHLLRERSRLRQVASYPHVLVGHREHPHDASQRNREDSHGDHKLDKRQALTSDELG